jgi:hypothetical protein
MQRLVAGVAHLLHFGFQYVIEERLDFSSNSCASSPRSGEMIGLAKI